MFDTGSVLCHEIPPFHEKVTLFRDLFGELATTYTKIASRVDRVVVG